MYGLIVGYTIKPYIWIYNVGKKFITNCRLQMFLVD